MLFRSVKDAFANVVPGATVVMSHLGTGTLTGSTSATSDSTGLANFSALMLDRAGVQRLSATSGSARLRRVQSPRQGIFIGGRPVAMAR